jgi:hypothetical protein
MKSAVKTSPVNMKARAEIGVRTGDTVRVWQNIVEIKQGKAANKKEVVGAYTDFGTCLHVDWACFDCRFHILASE